MLCPNFEGSGNNGGGSEVRWNNVVDNQTKGKYRKRVWKVIYKVQKV
jgi:hypothetical protein